MAAHDSLTTDKLVLDSLDLSNALLEHDSTVKHRRERKMRSQLTVNGGRDSIQSSLGRDSESLPPLEFIRSNKVEIAKNFNTLTPGIHKSQTLHANKNASGKKSHKQK
jgi:hypothetical protein